MYKFSNTNLNTLSETNPVPPSLFYLAYVQCRIEADGYSYKSVTLNLKFVIQVSMRFLYDDDISLFFTYFAEFMKEEKIHSLFHSYYLFSFFFFSVVTIL